VNYDRPENAKLRGLLDELRDVSLGLQNELQRVKADREIDWNRLKAFENEVAELKKIKDLFEWSENDLGGEAESIHGKRVTGQKLEFYGWLKEINRLKQELAVFLTVDNWGHDGAGWTWEGPAYVLPVRVQEWEQEVGSKKAMILKDRIKAAKDAYNEGWYTCADDPQWVTTIPTAHLGCGKCLECVLEANG